jgi:hypothetical protein
MKALTALIAGVANRFNDYLDRQQSRRNVRRILNVADEQPKVRRIVRFSLMRTGGPALKGKRLARVAKSSCSANQIKTRHKCECGQHTRLVFSGVDLSKHGDITMHVPTPITAAMKPVELGRTVGMRQGR